MGYAQTAESEDHIMLVGEEIIPPEDDEEQNLTMNAESRKQIERIKELRQQKRKLQATEYIPIDETAQQKADNQTTKFDSFEAQLLKKQLIA